MGQRVRTSGQAGLIILLTLAAYLPALRASFIWDDIRVYVLENPLVKAPDGLRRFWFSTQPLDYYPVTNTAFWIEWHLWGAHAAGYHATNVVLHALSSILLWRILRRLAVPAAWLAGLIYALHPVNVQSVAWISQLKNSLSTAFFFGSLLTSISFDQGGKRSHYVASVGLFLMSLLSKTSGVMLPFVLLGLDWWRSGRISRRAVRRALPYFALAVALGAVTYWFQKQASGLTVVREDGFPARLAGAGWAVWFYLYKALLPMGLTLVYPRWRIDPASVVSYLPLLVLVLLLGLLYRSRARWGRPLLAGLGFFVITLVPFLGFADIGYMQYSFVSDHWQYIPIAGIIALATGLAASPRVGGRPSRRALAGAAAAGVVLLLFTRTWMQAGIYKDEETAWRDTVRKNPRAWVAHLNLGQALAVRGQLADAAHELEESIRLEPDCPEAYTDLGSVLAQQGKFAAAAGQFAHVLALPVARSGGRLQAALPAAHYNLGHMLAIQGEWEQAEHHLAEAVRLKPQDSHAHYDLGHVLAERRKYREAVAEYSEVVRLEPRDADARYNLAILLSNLGDLQRAAAEYAQILNLRPDDAEAHRNLGDILAGQGRIDAALVHYRAALKLRPGWPEIETKLKQCETLRGRTPTAPPGS